MKQKVKSLRQLARELGVSHSYLSQIIHGKRSASKKMVSKMVSNGKQLDFDTIPDFSYNKSSGPLAQLAEQLTLNQPVGGSSPPRLISKLFSSPIFCKQTIWYYAISGDKSRYIRHTQDRLQGIRCYLER